MPNLQAAEDESSVCASLTIIITCLCSMQFPWPDGEQVWAGDR